MAPVALAACGGEGDGYHGVLLDHRQPEAANPNLEQVAAEEVVLQP